ncbi:Protein ICE2 [Pichia kudriavzevii]|uniref:Protein ICE2 n=1 Tax=Pichia kudriavzevii TaxID=4909 RepID=A0A1V2LQC2_PICKU|nr:Protein ICE2 [Pichia kudriavzevii]
MSNRSSPSSEIQPAVATVERTPSAGSIRSTSSTNHTRKVKVNETLIQLLRVLFSTIYLIYIVLTIPLSFEVGGVNCGLSYSLTILILYFCLATLRVLKYHRFISSFLYYLQHLLLPTLLSFFLTVFNDDPTVNYNQSIFHEVWWIYVINFWKFFLINSTPLFTILEGFCSLLSIQAIGQLFKYFIKNKSDTWSIINLILSSCILSTSIYFAGKIYVSPLLDLEHVGLISASLLGCVFTLTILITFYAIYFNRATTLESSLMVGYIVKCCYELFPDLSETNINSLFKFVFNEFEKIDKQAVWKHEDIANHPLTTKINAKLPYFSEKILNFLKIVKKNGNLLIKLILEHFPRSFEPLWDFVKISINNLTFSILMQLAYRIGVFFAATKIIPILSPVNKVPNTSSQPSTSSRLIYLYSPCIIIAVYTNLMIQYNYEIDKETHFFSWFHYKVMELLHSSSTITSASHAITKTVHSWQFWNWVNIFAVLLLYFSELVSYDPEDSALTDHWN